MGHLFPAVVGTELISLDLNESNMYFCRQKQIMNKRTYSTEAGGSRRAGRSRHSRLAGDTIVTRGASRTL